MTTMISRTNLHCLTVTPSGWSFGVDIYGQEAKPAI